MINYILFYMGILGTLIFLFLTVFIYFKSNIGEVLGDLTGYSPRKGSRYRNSQAALEPQKKRLGVSVIKVKERRVAKETEKLSNLETTELIIEDACETELIDSVSQDETVLLDSNDSEDTVLIDEEAFFFEVKRDMLIVHSNEFI